MNSTLLAHLLPRVRMRGNAFSCAALALSIAFTGQLPARGSLAVRAAPAILPVQLTQGGCCVQPFFAPDSARVLFLDKPAPAQPAGIYGVALNAPLSAATLVTERLGPFSRDMALAARLIDGRTVVERLSDGIRWTINNGGRSVSFSPDGARIVWTVDEESGGFDRRKSDVWLANSDGTQSRRIATRYGGAVMAWFNDGQRLLLGGRPKRNDPLPTLSVLTLKDGSLRDLISVERVRGVSLAPDGKHLVYFVAQARADGQGGVFMLDLDHPAPVRLPFFGAYRWRDAGRLLYVPLILRAPSNELWQYDVARATSERLIDAADGAAFKIGNGDWDVSADGRWITWLNARDRNIWAAQLP